MKFSKEEKLIVDAFEAIAPNSGDAVLADCRKQQKKGKVIKMPENKKKTKTSLRALSLIAAALLLVAGAAFAVIKLIPAAEKPVASVMIDVNPSIELVVDSNDRVLKAIANNGDAEAVLADMDLAGSNIKVAVNAVIGSMLRNGYLNELANSVLISVDSSDNEVVSRLRESLSRDIRELLGEGGIGCAVLSQAVDEHDPAVTELAEDYGVTPGKAQLILKLLAANPSYDTASLAALSINELAILSGQRAVSDLRSYGTSSTDAYIGADEAKRIALGSVEADEASVSGLKCELDMDKGRMVYEVEFDFEGFEYEIDVDAVTGEIVKSEREPFDGQPTQPTSAPETTPEAQTQPVITANQALAAACEHAGIAVSDAYDVETELDRDDGKLIWDVEFKANGKKYEYEIDAVSGKVAEYDSEPLHTAAPTAKPTEKPSSGSSYIGRTAALEAALEDAGLRKNEVRDIEIERKTKDGIVVYEVEFESAGTEYEYLINARTGEIVSRHSEQHDDHDDDDDDDDGHSGHHSGVSLIGEDRAWQIALERAGLSMSDIREKEIELDTDNGAYCYELDFKAGKYEYEVKINAVTGAVMRFERELDD